MKLLLDECAPKRLRNDFPDHEIRTLDEVGLKGLKNGQLLGAAVNQGFEVLITVDRKMPFQQNFSHLNLAANSGRYALPLRTTQNACAKSG